MGNALTPLQIATRAHLAADMLRARTYGRVNGQFRGCSVGCLVHDIEPTWTEYTIAYQGHRRVADHYGYPEWLVRLQDTVFEGLPADERNEWHVGLADAIAARGRDWPVILHAVQAAILRISGRTERADGWMASSARSVASAAEIAARSAAESAARSAMMSSATWNVSVSEAWSAAEIAAYQEIRDAVLAEIVRPTDA
jgi:hypothetical protein